MILQFAIYEPELRKPLPGIFRIESAIETTDYVGSADRFGDGSKQNRNKGALKALIF